MEIRDEGPGDHPAIRRITLAAFKDAPFSDQREAEIVDALRSAGALAVSLVAIEDGDIIGHIAFSPVAVGSGESGWYGLGPVSVRPDQQERGIGQALVRAGLDRLAVLEAAGCIVLGAPAYYGRFGFESDPALCFEGEPSPYLQRLVLNGARPRGEVRYHAGFAS